MKFAEGLARFERTIKLLSVKNHDIGNGDPEVSRALPGLTVIPRIDKRG